MDIVAVIDTNVWVSAFLNPVGFPAKVLAAAQARRFEVLTSDPLLDELLDVLQRSRLMRVRCTTRKQAEAFVNDIAEVTHIVPISGHLHLCRDPKDDIVLETAIVGGATHIVSRDEDLTRDPELLRWLEERNIRAVTVNRFLGEVGM